MSGSKVNIQKSELIPVREVPHFNLVDLFGCEVEILPSSDLDLPLGYSSTSVSVLFYLFFLLGLPLDRCD